MEKKKRVIRKIRFWENNYLIKINRKDNYLREIYRKITNIR